MAAEDAALADAAEPPSCRVDALIKQARDNVKDIVGGKPNLG